MRAIAEILPETLDAFVEGRVKKTFDESAYESPIERIFAWHAFKFLADDAELIPQVEVQTLCGRFRLDFVIERGGRRIGVECDGADFHDLARDEFRDAAILQARTVSAIYRFRGADLFHRADSCVFHLARQEPWAFDGRRFHVLQRAAELDPSKHPETGMAFMSLRFESQRHSLDNRFLAGVVELIERRGGGPVSEIMDAWREVIRRNVE